MPYAVKNISIDKDRCIECKLCEKSCPTNSINIYDKYVIKNTCILCQRCLNICPKNAFKNKDKNIDQYKIEKYF